MIYWRLGYHPSGKEILPFLLCLGIEMIPNGRRHNRLNGVMKVVSLDDSGDKPICHNPEFASSLLNTFAPASWASVWSTQGKGWNSLKMSSLSLVRSIQIHTLSLALGTTTIPAHYSVGSLTLEIMCICSIRASSSLTFKRRGTGTLLGVLRGFVWRLASAWWRSQVHLVFCAQRISFGNCAL